MLATLFKCLVGREVKLAFQFARMMAAVAAPFEDREEIVVIADRLLRSRGQQRAGQPQGREQVKIDLRRSLAGQLMRQPHPPQSLEMTGDHIDYVDDTGFTADGDFVNDVLYHAGMVLRRVS